MKAYQEKQTFSPIRITFDKEKEAAAFFDFLLRARTHTSKDDFQMVMLSSLLEKLENMTIQHPDY